MMNFEYSVAIRTLGTAGEKYVKLMNSIKNSNVQPKQVIVVLPKGYTLPKKIIGTEQFIFSKKGMLPQRIEGLNFSTSRYTLFCDDDVEFDENFVEKLAQPLLENGYSCSAGPLLEFFPPSGLKYGLASFLGGACKMIRKKENMYVRILNTGGWSYNSNIDINNHKIYNTESLPGTCFMVDTNVMKQANLDDEYWCEKTGYSAFEDRIMISKILSNKYTACVVSDAVYKHNDGKTSTRNLKLEPIYASSFNHYVFWHRFLYKPSKNVIDKLWKLICINYYVFMSRIYNYILVLTKKLSTEGFMASKNGFKDAKKYVKSEEYLNLPLIYMQE